jgi:hypothetical protein
LYMRGPENLFLFVSYRSNKKYVFANASKAVRTLPYLETCTEQIK